MPDVRAGLMKVATVTLRRTARTDTIVAGGDVWIDASPGAIVRIETLQLLPEELEGSAQSVTRLTLRDGTQIMTTAEAAGEGGLLEAAETAQTVVVVTTDAAGVVTGGSSAKPREDEVPL